VRRRTPGFTVKARRASGRTILGEAHPKARRGGRRFFGCIQDQAVLSRRPDDPERGLTMRNHTHVCFVQEDRRERATRQERVAMPSFLCVWGCLNKWTSTCLKRSRMVRARRCGSPRETYPGLAPSRLLYPRPAPPSMQTPTPLKVIGNAVWGLRRRHCAHAPGPGTPLNAHNEPYRKQCYSAAPSQPTHMGGLLVFLAQTHKA